MTNILFVCSANVDRSPTAERMYKDRPQLKVKSAGVHWYATRKVDETILQWADVVLCMEEFQKQMIMRDFTGVVAGIIIDYLDVDDDYERMSPELKEAIKKQMDAWLRESLNNRALYYLESGNPDEAEKRWKIALDIDPDNAICLYNYYMYLWKTARIDDMEAVHRFTFVTAKDMNHYTCLSKLHLARGDADSAIECLNEAASIYGKTEAISQALAKAKERKQKRLDGRCIHTLKGHNDAVISVRFSPDGKQVFTAGRKTCISTGVNARKVKIWDVKTGACLETAEIKWSDHSPCVPDEKFSFLLGNKYWEIWKNETVKRIHPKEAHTDQINSVCYTPDGKIAITGSQDSTVKLWDSETGVCIRTLKGHTYGVASVNISPDGKIVISGGADHTVKLWRLETGFCICTLEGHAARVECVSISPDGTLAVSGSDDDTARIWRLPVTVESDYELIKAREIVHDKAENFKTLAAEINLLLDKKKIRAAATGFKKLRKMTSFAYGETYFALAARLSSYCVSRRLNHYVRQMITYECEKTWDFHWSYGSKDHILALSENENIIKVWDMTTRRWIFEDSFMDDHYCVCFNPDGTQCLSGSYKEIILLNIETGKYIQTLKWDKRTVCAATFSPDGRQCLSGSDSPFYEISETVKLWDISTGQCLRTLAGHRDIVNSVCFTPDGKRALTASDDWTVIIWDLAKGNKTATFQGHESGVDIVCVSPDGKTALSCCGLHSSYTGDNHVAVLWEIALCEPVRLLEGHTSYILSLGFSPDGKLAVSGSCDKTVKIWDVATGKCLCTFKGFSYHVDKVCFSPNGRQIAAASDNEIHLFTLDFDLHFPGWHDWDEGARPYLENFLALHPGWTDDDFYNILIPDLQKRGYGWLRPEGVRAKCL